MSTTLNQIKKDILEIAQHHKFINDYFWGSPERIAKEKDVKYPLFFAFPVTLRVQNNMTERTIRMGVVDKITKEWSNLDDVHSDCGNHLRDFYRVLNKSPRLRRLWRIENQPQGEYFTLHDKGDHDNADYVAGAYFDVSINTVDKSGVCDVPIDCDYDFKDKSVCDLDFVTIRLVNSLGELLTVREYPPSSTQELIAPNAQYTLESASGEVIGSGEIPSGVDTPIVVEVNTIDISLNNEVIVSDAVNDVDLLLKDTNGNEIDYTYDDRVIEVDIPVVTPINVNINDIEVVAHATTDVDLSLVDENGDAVDFTHNGTVITVESAPPSSPSGFTRMPFKTGQTTSYATGDDGDLQDGQDFFILPIINGVQQLNHFGSKWRFTGVNGGYWDRDNSVYKLADGTTTTRTLAYLNDLRIDHATRDWNNNVLMWSFNVYSDLSWSEALNACNVLSVDTFTNGWFMPNINQLLSVWNTNQPNNVFSPVELLNSGLSFSIWSSTTVWYSTGFAHAVANNTMIGAGSKTTSYSFLPCRITNLSEL